MLEIEAKIQVDDFTALRSRLAELGACRAGQYLETNVFFDTSHRTLLAADSGLRLRRNHNLDTNHDQFILTFKGPQQPGPLKKREERELTVASDLDAIAFLQALGYEQTLRFEKRRETWRLADCEIALDELPDLGKFVEIEGPAEPSIQRVRKHLDLADKSLILKSYAALLSSR